MGRMGEADEVANAALFLASGDSNQVRRVERVADRASIGMP